MSIKAGHDGLRIARQTSKWLQLLPPTAGHPNPREEFHASGAGATRNRDRNTGVHVLQMELHLQDGNVHIFKCVNKFSLRLRVRLLDYESNPGENPVLRAFL